MPLQRKIMLVDKAYFGFGLLIFFNRKGNTITKSINKGRSSKSAKQYIIQLHRKEKNNIKS